MIDALLHIIAGIFHFIATGLGIFGGLYALGHAWRAYHGER